MTDPNGWPDASKPGVPLNPERDGAHVLDAGPDRTGKRRRIVALWNAGSWHLGTDYSVLARDAANWGWRYVGPCHTPAEVAALIEAARREEREACAKVAEREMRDLFGDAEEYQQGWNAGIEAAVFRIRARGDA
jgi:hypothetical protein